LPKKTDPTESIRSTHFHQQSTQFACIKPAISTQEHDNPYRTLG